LISYTIDTPLLNNLLLSEQRRTLLLIANRGSHGLKRVISHLLRESIRKVNQLVRLRHMYIFNGYGSLGSRYSRLGKILKPNTLHLILSSSTEINNLFNVLNTTATTPIFRRVNQYQNKNQFSPVNRLGQILTPHSSPQ
jgi:hypothetical protein